MTRYLVYLLVSSFILSSCSTSKQVSLAKYFDKHSIFSDHFTGFVLYDPISQKNIYDYQADHFFTPASNTKIVTFYSALKTMADSAVAIQYKTVHDTLFLWGTGDPSTLNPAFDDQDFVLEFISDFNLPVVFCKDNFRSERFGEGWAWDDYLYYYQAEKTSFPVFGNLLQLNLHPSREEMVWYPNLVHVDSRLGKKFNLWRSPASNHFTIDWPTEPKDIQVVSPLHIDDILIENVFSKYLRQSFQMAKTCPIHQDKKAFSSIPLDTIYAEMMQHSDNFIAEQLLLSISGIMTDTLDTQLAIQKIKEHYLREIANDLQWYDGSGLSRYNMFTPRAITYILNEIYQILSLDQIKRFFPTGGKSGTIKDWYANENGAPYVYAKTGSLKNVHCLSGYLFTDSGKVLIFSFMHNNFTGPSSQVKEKMQRVLKYIKSKY